MASRTLPNLDLTGFFDLGEDGWNDEMDLNLLKLSVLVQGGVQDKLAGELVSPVSGDIIILDEAHPTNANAVAVYDDGAWVYFAPSEGWLLYNQAQDYYEKFDGTVWAELATGGSGGLADAPSDGTIYGRQNGAWVAAGSGGGSGGSGAMELISEHDLTAAASVDIEGFAGKGYDKVQIFISGNASDDGSALLAQFKIGGSYVTTGYGRQIRFTPDSSNNIDQRDDNATHMTLTGNGSNYGLSNTGTHNGLRGNVEIITPDATDVSNMLWVHGTSIMANGNQITSYRGSGGSNTEGAIEGLRIEASAGTFTGRIAVYGIKAVASGGGSALSFAQFKHIEPAGTAGGNATTGAWTTRTLNTESLNDIAGASMATSVITLPAGTYKVAGGQVFYRTNYTQVRLQDTTNNVTLASSVTQYIFDDADGHGMNAPINGVFTLAAQADVEFQYYCSANANINSTGLSVAGVEGQYADLLIEKVA